MRLVNLMIISILHKDTECKKLAMVSKKQWMFFMYIKGSNIFSFLSWVKEKKMI